MHNLIMTIHSFQFIPVNTKANGILVMIATLTKAIMLNFLA
ncbi:MAG: hypothetical protein ACPL25_01970 [Ignavibacteria bacterium]